MAAEPVIALLESVSAGDFALMLVLVLAVIALFMFIVRGR